MRNRLPVNRWLVTSILVGLLSAGVVGSARPDDGSPGPSGPRYPVVVHRGAALPPPSSQSKAVPLVLALHPSGGSPQGFEATSGLDRVADQYGFVVAYLSARQPTSPAWTSSDLQENLAYVSAEIKQLVLDQNVDPNRVYVTGFSAGATMAFFIGCQLSSQVAGIAVVSGYMRFSDQCTVSHPLSQLLVIGSRERVDGTAVLLSADQVATKWRGLNGCTSASSQAQSGPVSETSWSTCDDKSGVGLDVIAGGTHVWPGGPLATGPDAAFDAAQAVWSFFAAHPGPAGGTIPSATLSRLTVQRSGLRRTIALRFAVDEKSVSLTATLKRAGRVVVTKRGVLSRSTQAPLTLTVPPSKVSGRCSLSLVLSDRYGRKRTLVKSLLLPRAG